MPRGGTVNQPAGQGSGSRAAWIRKLGPQAPVIVASAIAHGVDPLAALAVAHGEGGFSNPTPVGDHGTSFGPFQLHIGGALPSAYWNDPAAANRWANSPQGIDYAVGRMAEVARGKKGRAAIDAIVRNFERPADPDPEVARDAQWYNAAAAGRFKHPLSGPARDPGAGLTGGVPQPAGFPTNPQAQAGVAPGTVPNVFTSCKVVGAGPGGDLPLVGGVVGTATGFLTGQSEGGILCYVTGLAKVTAMSVGGLIIMGVGFYLLLPRGARSKLNSATLGTAQKGAELLPAGRAAKAATAATAAKGTAHREATQRAQLRTSRARAREAEAKARTAQYNAPGKLRLSQRQEDAIRRAQGGGQRGRPDRVKS